MTRKNLLKIASTITIISLGAGSLQSQVVSEPPKYVPADSIFIQKIDLNNDGTYEGILTIKGKNYIIEQYEEGEIFFSPYNLPLPIDSTKTNSMRMDSMKTLDSTFSE